jgi:hypothetical protein
MSIALNMITGKFKEPLIKEAINSVLPIVNELVFVDTSPGNNPNIEDIKSFNGAKIILYEEDMDFAKARNLNKKYTESEWIIRLDADEIVNECFLDEIVELSKSDASAIEAKLWHHMLHPDYIIDRDRDIKPILLRTNDFDWIHSVHEQPMFKCGYKKPAWHIKRNHYGWCLNPEHIYEKHRLYEKLGGITVIKTNYYPNWIVDFCKYYYGFTTLIKYKQPHPLVASKKLIELFPDLGTYTRFEVE